MTRVAMLLTLVVLAGCSTNECTKGEAATCACSDGRAGAQMCDDKGAFGACVCSAASTGVSTCVPGSAATCACDDGRAGAQACQADGSYAACVCAVGVDAGSVSTCVPGSAATCACTDGRAGAQTCQADGSYAACVCSNAPVTDGGTLSSDSALAGLSVTPGKLVFSPDVLTYAVTVLPNTTTLNVTASVAQPAHAVISIDGHQTNSGTPVSVALISTVTNIAIDVRADSGASRSYLMLVTRVQPTQSAMLFAFNRDQNDAFSCGLALSGDGNTLAVGACNESSAASTTPGDNSAPSSGAVYLFTRTAPGWAFQTFLKAPTIGSGDKFGSQLALSDDGSTLAVSAPGEASSLAAGQSDNSLPGSGAVYVFGRSGASWVIQGFIKASNAEADDAFGSVLALSADGATLAIGAPNEDASATGGQNDNSATDSGAVYVFTHDNAGWSQQSYLKASNAGTSDVFGSALAMNAAGSRLVVGAPGESSAVAAGPGDDSAGSSGAAYVFSRGSSSWAQDAFLKASNAEGADLFGTAVSMNGDGSMIVAGAPSEDSHDNFSTDDNTCTNCGAVYVFTRGATSWSQLALLHTPTSMSGITGANTLALDRSGNTLAVGAPREYSASGAGYTNAGGVTLFTRNFSGWTAQAHFRSQTSTENAYTGNRVSFDVSGTMLAVSVVGSNGSDFTGAFLGNVGAAYVFGW